MASVTSLQFSNAAGNLITGDFENLVNTADARARVAKNLSLKFASQVQFVTETGTLLQDGDPLPNTGMLHVQVHTLTKCGLWTYVA